MEEIPGSKAIDTRHMVVSYNNMNSSLSSGAASEASSSTSIATLTIKLDEGTITAAGPDAATSCFSPLMRSRTSSPSNSSLTDGGQLLASPSGKRSEIIYIFKHYFNQ